MKSIGDFGGKRNQMRTNRKEEREVESVKATKYKISVEGYEEYKEEIQEMKNAVIEYREEIDKLNASMEREIELIEKLKQLR